jgi:hypothetical protein
MSSTKTFFSKAKKFCDDSMFLKSKSESQQKHVLYVNCDFEKICISGLQTSKQCLIFT